VGTATGYSPPLRRSYHLTVTWMPSIYIYICITHCENMGHCNFTYPEWQNIIVLYICHADSTDMTIYGQQPKNCWATTQELLGNNPKTVSYTSYKDCYYIITYIGNWPTYMFTLPQGGKKVDKITHMFILYSDWWFWWIAFDKITASTNNVEICTTLNPPSLIKCKLGWETISQ
jgi:hypothetical protein